MEESGNSTAKIEVVEEKAVMTIEDPFSEQQIKCEDVKISVSDKEVTSDNGENVTSEAPHFEDDGEDLPDNFFDDFSNQDFMAGLDIVDDWIDDENNEEKDIETVEADNEPAKPIEKTKDVKYVPQKSKDKLKADDDRSKYDRNRRRYSREDNRYRFKRRSRSPRGDLSRRKSRSRDRRSRSNRRYTENKKEIQDKLTDDQRRDPEKTKRDIQRDKVRCAKDMEARVFQEQLRVAETGLVPPGTELDVILEKEKLKAEAEREREKKVEEEKVKKQEKRSPASRSHLDKPAQTEGSKPYSPTQDTAEDVTDKSKESHFDRKKLVKVPESDLVPPGTEDSKAEKEGNKIKKPTVVKDAKKDDQQRSAGTRTDRRRNKSPKTLGSVRSRRSRSRSFSPKRRRRDSWRRDRDSREVDLRYRLREKREKYVNDLSPVSDKRLPRSPSLSNVCPQSMLSDRESWLRGRDRDRDRERDRERNHDRERDRGHDRERDFRRRSRSCSPISPNSFSDKDRVSPRRRPRKFTFMEELEIKFKINQMKQQPNLLVTVPNNVQGHPPAMVPPPHEFMPHGPGPFQPSMFMGSGPGPSMCPPPDHYPNMHMAPDPLMIPPLMAVPVPNPVEMVPHPQQQIQHPMVPQGIPEGVPAPVMAPFLGPESCPGPGLTPGPVPCPVPPVTLPIVYLEPKQAQPSSAQFKTQTNLQDFIAEDKELTKLFEDKKISLSDFLSVAAKPIDPTTPVSIHNKIKVISRCQEAVKLLEEPTLTGRFFPKFIPQLAEAEKRASDKAVNQSPLRKTVVRFNFTTPVNKRVHSKLMGHPGAGVYLHKVLSLLGIPKEDKLPPEVKPEVIVPEPGAPKPVPAPVIATKKINSASQTEPYKCQICEIRKSRKYSTEGTQTTERTTFDIGTQVSIEDLNKSCATFTPRGILKNTSSVQSISHLTPAQLLAQLEKEKQAREARSYDEQVQSNPRTSADRFGESFRNPNPYNDSYAGDRDRFSNFGGQTPELNRNEFNQNRGNEFMNPPRIADNRTEFMNRGADNRSEFINQNRGPDNRNMNPNRGDMNRSEFMNPNRPDNWNEFMNRPSNNRSEFMNPTRPGLGSQENRGNFGIHPQYDNREEFGNRGGNFVPGADRNLEGTRRFPEGVNSNFASWNPAMGRGVNPRFNNPWDPN